MSRINTRCHPLSLWRVRRGMTLVELLVAVVILSIVGAGAVATWRYSSKVPANKRVTDMASILAIREIEVVKAKKYLNLATGTTTTYYDRYGAARDSGGTKYTSAQSQGYTATTTVGIAPGMTATGTTRDLLEVVAVVTNASGTKTYETQRTLLTFGGF